MILSLNLLNMYLNAATLATTYAVSTAVCGQFQFPIRRRFFRDAIGNLIFKNNRLHSGFSSF